MKFNTTTSLKRFRGALLGLAVGDALGTTLEFKPPGTFEPLTDMIGGGPFNLNPGEWTDDTSMALCLADSLLQCSCFDPRDQLARYCKWFRDGYLSSNGRCFDIGMTVRSALTRFEETQHPYCGSTHPRSAGNGSIMRLAPVPMFFARDATTAIMKCADSSRTTHATVEAIDACRFLGGIILGALRGFEKEKLLSLRFSPAAGIWDTAPLAKAIDEVACGSFARKNPPEIRSTGYVVDSLEAALWAFHRTSSFGEGCLLAANLGGDSDTTAAVYGEIAGSFYGESAIPEEWRAKLAHRSLIESFADRLFLASGFDEN